MLRQIIAATTAGTNHGKRMSSLAIFLPNNSSLSNIAMSIPKISWKTNTDIVQIANLLS